MTLLLLLERSFKSTSELPVLPKGMGGEGRGGEGAERDRRREEGGKKPNLYRKDVDAEE